MSNVTRYDLISDLGDGGSASMETRQNGDYVRADDYDDLRSLLVKACVEIADRIDMTSVAKIIEHVEQNYGIRLRWTGAMFTEDTTK